MAGRGTPVPMTAAGRRTSASSTPVGGRTSAAIVEALGQTATRAQANSRATPPSLSSGSGGVPQAQRSDSVKHKLSALSR